MVQASTVGREHNQGELVGSLPLLMAGQQSDRWKNERTAWKGGRQEESCDKRTSLDDSKLTTNRAAAGLEEGTCGASQEVRMCVWVAPPHRLFPALERGEEAKPDELQEGGAGGCGDRVLRQEKVGGKPGLAKGECLKPGLEKEGGKGCTYPPGPLT